MTKKLTIYTTVIVIVCSVAVNAAADTWIMYTNGNDIVDMASHGVYIWCATTGGVVRWDTRDMSYTKYTTLDGLPTNGINAIDTGPVSEVWCGTDYGAARFQDGVWEIFTEEDGLYDDYVNDVAVDSKGVVWLSTDDGGISRFDGKDWRVFLWPDELPRRWITTLKVDSNDDVWFGVYGLYKYDGESFFSMTESIDNPQFRTFEIGPDGDIWMTIGSDLYYYNDSNWELHKGSEILSWKIVHAAIHFSQNGTAWFAQGSNVWKYEDGFVEVADLPVSDIGTITTNSDNTIWLGNRINSNISEDACLIKLHDKVWEYYSTDDSIYVNHFLEADISPDGCLGLATYYGLYKFSNNSSSLLNPYHNSLYSEGADCLSFDTTGGVWYGKRNGLFYIFDKEFRKCDFSDMDIGYSVSHISALHPNCVWFSTVQESISEPYGKGVTKWDGTEFNNYRMTDGLVGDWVQAITFENENNVWVGAKARAEGHFYKAAAEDITGGVSRFDGSAWQSWYPEDGIAHYDVLSLAAESDGDIWAGTRAGASRFNGETWESYYVEDGLPDDRINCIAVDHDDVVWFGTDNGAASFDGSTWATYSVADGLPDNIINDIVVDHDNNVMFFTDHGFSVLERSETFVENNVDEHPEMIEIGSYPNPFNPVTTIEFSIPAPSDVRLIVYSVSGQKAATLADGFMPAGKHTAVFDGSDMASGLYFYRLEAGKNVRNGKMLLVK